MSRKVCLATRFQANWYGIDRGALPFGQLPAMIRKERVTVPTSPHVRTITTDSPFKHMRPKVVERKRHYNETLVMGDVRKLIETAQEVLSQQSKTFPRAFWEIFARRCIQSMHLFNPLELAIVARTFDAHDPQLRPWFDVYRPIAEQARGQARDQKGFPGLAILVFSEIFPKRLDKGKIDVKSLLTMLGRQAAKVMWEFSPGHAIRVLATLTETGIRDASICARVAKKIEAQLGVPGSLELDELASLAWALSKQDHRDLVFFANLADYAASRCEEIVDSKRGVADAAKALGRILEAFQTLGIDDVPARLRSSFEQAELVATEVARDETDASPKNPGEFSAEFSLEDVVGEPVKVSSPDGKTKKRT